MRIGLVRHGETENNFKGNIQGRSNSLLSDNGRRQAKLLRMKLDGKDYDICFTSPLVRCVETSMILIGDKIEMIPDKRLIERDMGDLEGRPFEEYNRYKFWDYDLNWSKFNIEPIQNVFKRCNDFLDWILEKYPDKNILIVTHGATYRALRYLILKKPLRGKMFDGFISNCQFEEFNIKKEKSSK